MQSEEMPQVTNVESAVKDLPLLKALVTRGIILVYPRNGWERHAVKSAEKKVLFKARWKPMSKVRTYYPFRHRLIVRNSHQEEVLNMTRNMEAFDEERTRTEMVMTATPDIPIGRIIKDGRCMYEVIDHNGQVVYHVEKLVNKLPKNKYYTIMKPDGTEIGTIGDNNGEKHTLRVPQDLPLYHKLLLLGLTLSKQELYDENKDNEV